MQPYETWTKKNISTLLFQMYYYKGVRCFLTQNTVVGALPLNVQARNTQDAKPKPFTPNRTITLNPKPLNP